MAPNKLLVKNMVCHRCVLAVEDILLGITMQDHWHVVKAAEKYKAHVMMLFYYNGCWKKKQYCLFTDCNYFNAGENDFGNL